MCDQIINCVIKLIKKLIARQPSLTLISFAGFPLYLIPLLKTMWKWATFVTGIILSLSY